MGWAHLRHIYMCLLGSGDVEFGLKRCWSTISHARNGEMASLRETNMLNSPHRSVTQLGPEFVT